MPPRHVYSGSALSLLKQVATLRAVGCRRGCGGADIVTEQGARRKSADTFNNMQTDSQGGEGPNQVVRIISIHFVLCPQHSMHYSALGVGGDR